MDVLGSWRSSCTRTCRSCATPSTRTSSRRTGSTRPSPRPTCRSSTSSTGSPRRRAVPHHDVAVAAAGGHAARRAAHERATRAVSTSSASWPRRRCSAPATTATSTAWRCFYRTSSASCGRLFDDRYGGDLVGAFRGCRTRAPRDHHLRRHARLPAAHAAEPEAVRAQMQVAVRAATSGTSAASRGHLAARVRLLPGRRGAAGRGRAPLLLRRRPRHRQRHAAPALRRLRAGVTPSGVAAFGRDPESSKQVWSAGAGYPGDAATASSTATSASTSTRLHQPYMQPDGIRSTSGIKYFRITGKTRAQGALRPGPRARARRRPRGQLHVQPRAADRAPGRAAWTGRRPSWSRPTTPSSTATGGSRGRVPRLPRPQDRLRPAGRSGWSRPATTCARTRSSRWPRRRSAPGARAATRASGSTAPTTGSTATCTRRRADDRAGPRLARTPTTLHPARAQPGRARAAPGAVLATGPSS